MNRTPRRFVVPLFPLAVVVSATLSARAGSDVNQYLRDKYQHKTLILRGFPSGSSLHFDSSGMLRDNTEPGDWTVDGVVLVDDVNVSGDRLSIRAIRLHLGWVGNSGPQDVIDYDDKGKPDKDQIKNRTVRIEADLRPGEATTGAVEGALSKVFLSAQDNFVDLVPDYWKSCVRAAAGAGAATNSPSCHFSPEFLAVPGVAIRQDAATDTNPVDPRRLPSGSYHVGGGVYPPRVTYNREPEFSPPARRAKFQGTVTLIIVVNKEGLPTRIQILSPLGCGLDAKAVHAVEAWKFDPARKDGEPVAVVIAVEVDFHLY